MSHIDCCLSVCVGCLMTWLWFSLCCSVFNYCHCCYLFGVVQFGVVLAVIVDIVLFFVVGVNGCLICIVVSCGWFVLVLFAALLSHIVYCRVVVCVVMVCSSVAAVVVFVVFAPSRDSLCDVVSGIVVAGVFVVVRRCVAVFVPRVGQLVSRIGPAYGTTFPRTGQLVPRTLAVRPAYNTLF